MMAFFDRLFSFRKGGIQKPLINPSFNFNLNEIHQTLPESQEKIENEQLRLKDYLAFELYKKGFNFREIAGEAGVPVGAIKARIKIAEMHTREGKVS